MKHKWLIFLVLAGLLIGNSTTVLADDPTPATEDNESTFLGKDENVFEVREVKSSPNMNTLTGPALLNGNFEAGATGWSEFSSNAYALIGIPGFLTPHSGSWISWLGGGNTVISQIAQTNLTINGSTHLNLWYWIGSQDGC